ncbi:MAG: hypothetical protein C4536_09540 [Actinobacteria bacterium]|nr:MAG: hypothetical protein C4536_09540 [Actinomycetota bacterium]
MLREDRPEVSGKGRTRKVLPFVLIATMVLLAFQFTQLDKSKKRFIVHLLKQAPYLPGRYYA